MKLALIPPFSQLPTTNRTHYQLMLPHLLRSGEYAYHYRALCARSDQYVILDNGAAEHEQFTPEALLMIAEEYGVDEVVAPDVLGDANQTVVSSTYFSQLVDDESYRGKMGVVAQGTNRHEAFDTAVRLVDMLSNVRVVYIPRLLIRKNDPWARIKLAQDLYHELGEGIEFHFLGASSLFPNELQLVAKEASFVRGMDTSMPYNYAFGHSYLEGRVVKQIDRPKDYFDLNLSLANKDVMNANISTMLSWVGGDS